MSKKKILVVDDEPQFRLLVQKRLQANGYDVVQAVDGADGLEKARTEKPDLILLDIMMPHMNGVEVLKVLKSEDTTRDIPVVMLTAKGETDLILDAQEIGAADYFIKPFEPELFLTYIKRYV